MINRRPRGLILPGACTFVRSLFVVRKLSSGTLFVPNGICPGSRLHRRVGSDTPVLPKLVVSTTCGGHRMGVKISLRPRKRERDRMEIEVLNQWACLLEPPSEACGESQRTTVRLSNFMSTINRRPRRLILSGAYTFVRPRTCLTARLAGVRPAEPPGRRWCDQTQFPSLRTASWLDPRTAAQTHRRGSAFRARRHTGW
jgi:hypothetical protein